MMRAISKLRLGWWVLGLAGMLSACGGGSNGTPLYTVSGVLSGLPSGAQITLADNASDTLTLNANGNFSFAQSVAQSGNYAVTVATAPAGQVCTVSNGSGTGISSNVTNVTVACAPSTSTYTIGGQVSGLGASSSVVLLDNNAGPVTVNANGSFTFANGIAAGGGYAVTVGTQPAGQTCTVSNASGAGVNANITNVSVVCASSASYTIGGSVSGLPSGQQLSLVDNGDSTHALSVTSNGAFTFPNAVSGAYAVTVGTQPSGATCTVSSGSGTATANVTNVAVSCSVPNDTIGGTVSGLSSGQTATLELNGDAANTVALTSTTSSFTFPTPVAQGGPYAVTVATQPTAETCTVTNGNGTAAGNVTNVGVSCATAASALTFSSGFQTTATNPATTVEGGGYGGYGGSSLDGNSTYAPSSGFGAGTVAQNSLTPASTYMYFYYQFPAAALPANAPTYEYVGAYVQAPGVTALNGSGDTKGVTISGQNYLQFTLNENAEWANASSNNFLIILTLGKYYNIGTSSAPTVCRLQLQDVVKPASATAAKTATAYKVALSDFTVAQNCNQPISTVAQALAASPISQIDFQAAGGTSALKQGVNGLVSSSNLSVSTQTTGGAAPYLVPTTLALTGGISFAP